MDCAISDLETDNITFVSKNALVKKRNNERTYNHFQTINNNLLEALYDKSNGFIKPYSYSLDKQKSYLVETKYPDKKLFINNTTKRFIGCDGMQLNVSGQSVDGSSIKKSKNGLYGVILISGLFDIIKK